MPSGPNKSPSDDQARVSRRKVILGIATLPLLAACSGGDDSLASATKGGVRTNFVDSVGWVEIGGRSAIIAFTPFKLTTAQREAVVAGRGVYPALSEDVPMLELRIELKPSSTASALIVGPENVAVSQLTFWHFSNPPAVIRNDSGQWGDNAEMTFVDLDGDMRSGGWVSGTCRGQKLVTTQIATDAYTWNLTFQLSLS